MEGPTTASTLIHAATLVTAGIYLLAKVSNSATNSSWMPLIGAVTCVVTSYLSAYQHDVKRALAYSTSSQIGLLFFSSLLMGSMSYHLFTHAIFKSALFLIVGAYLHSNNEQIRDNRVGQIIDNKLSKYLITVTALSLVAIPASMGGNSKEATYT